MLCQYVYYLNYMQKNRRDIGRYTKERTIRYGQKNRKSFMTHNEEFFSIDKRKSIVSARAWRRGGGPSGQDKSERSFAKRGVIDGENLQIVGDVSSGRSRWWGCPRDRRGRGRRCWDAVREKCDRRRDVSPISRMEGKRRVKKMIEVGIIVRRRQESPHRVDLQGLVGGGGKEGENPDHLRSEVLRTAPTRLDVSCMPLDYIALSSCLPGDRYGAPRVLSFILHVIFFFFFFSLLRHLHSSRRKERRTNGERETRKGDTYRSISISTGHTR